MPGNSVVIANSARRLGQSALAVVEQAQLIEEVAGSISAALRAGGKLYVFGNGGSAACAQHFAAEFTGKLSSDRPPISGMALTVDTSAVTAIANDYSFDDIFARQVRAHARSGDIVIGLTTSGGSVNVRAGIEEARRMGAVTVVLTGSRADRAGVQADYVLSTLTSETARVQETHDLILHSLCQVIEKDLYPDIATDASRNEFGFVISPGELAKMRAWCTETQQSLVTTNGAFDLLHAGHAQSLRECRGLGDRLVVLVNSDASVTRLKGASRPIQRIEERLQALERVVWVDHVAVFEDTTPMEMLQSLRPDVHAKGGEYHERPMPERDLVESWGGRVVLLDMLADSSTSGLVARLRQDGR